MFLLKQKIVACITTNYYYKLFILKKLKHYNMERNYLIMIAIKSTATVAAKPDANIGVQVLAVWIWR